MRHLLRKCIALLALTFGLLAAGPASAASFIVMASANSSTGGSGVATVALNAGDWFSVSVDPGDLWSAGALPRWSNADGLAGNLYATGSDDSGQAAGTLIGSNFGLWSQGGLSAPYGALVGRIGGGSFFLLGTSFAGNAATSGVLSLFYWDSNAGDNTQFITANVAAVPEPSAYLMLFAGLGLLGFAARRRTSAGSC